MNKGFLPGRGGGFFNQEKQEAKSENKLIHYN